MDISRELINKFRDEVNDNSYFVLHKYGEKDNKNQWNCICSSMDWIEVSIDYILEYKNKIQKKSFDMTVYGYISAIDNIFEAITQLHRVLLETKEVPFNNEYNIFLNNELKYDDNKYFKHIRAVFGAHPVNLKVAKGKCFASYPSAYHDEYDYAVSIWSNNLDVQDIIFGFKIDDLNKFLYSRYTYLNQLIKIINKEFKNFEENMKKKIISEGNTPLEKLQNLQVASKERLDNEYYKETIGNLIFLFNANFPSEHKNKVLVNKYLKKAQKTIDELYSKLQNMIFDNLEYDIFDYNIPRDISYEVSKFFDQIIFYRLNLQDYNQYFLKNIISRLKEYFEDDIIIDKNMEISEIYLLISAVLHFKN